MDYYKLLRQPESERRIKEYYCDDQGNIYSKLLSTGEFRKIKLGKTYNGYLVIRTLKGYRVNRAVWEAINKISIPEDKVVDHVDNDKLNNKITNLQLLTQKDNSKKSNDVPVDMLNLEGNFLQMFASLTDASNWLRKNGYAKAAPAGIWNACNGKVTYAYERKWRYHG